MKLDTHAKKLKLLKIVEILKKYTDTDKILSTSEMQEYLLQVGIETDRRTLSNDMKLLKQNGYDIGITRKNRQNAYFIRQHKFSMPEIKMMISAVQAANFISNVQTGEMLEKLVELADDETKELLKHNNIQYNSRKYNNPEVFQNIEILESSINLQKQASFCYFDLDENRNRVYRRNGDRYIVDPIRLIYFEDFFYLLTWSRHHLDLTTYRVDRISMLKIEESDVSKNVAEIMKGDKTEKLITQAFKLFGGKEKRVKLIFENKLIGSVFDKFGDKVNICRINDTLCMAIVTIQESPTWKGWLAQFQGKMTAEDMF